MCILGLPFTLLLPFGTSMSSEPTLLLSEAVTIVWDIVWTSLPFGTVSESWTIVAWDTKVECEITVVLPWSHVIEIFVIFNVILTYLFYVKFIYK